MGTTTTSMTFEQFEQLPDEPNKLELIDGEVIRMPPAYTPHMRISLFLFETLKRIVLEMKTQGRVGELGEVFHEFGYQIGPHWLVPDVSITHAGQAEGKYLQGAPALSVEVISRRNTAEIMQRKVKLYMEYGGTEAWLWYPRSRLVMVHRGRTAVQMEGTLTSELLPGASFDLEEIFGAAKPTKR
ncbi:MAG TPA: Uma2 family endonuclease [Bryobacteraceae bacterium]|nr:Uma2 family endonuclease [Bryobacteraceae bacterium]